jgi:Ethanolamine utilization protein EutJ (predicted chaperonin)
VFAVFREAADAVRAGVRHDAAEARPIVRRWLSALARRVGRRDLRAFAAEMLREADTERHRRERRFWELVAVLRPEVANSPATVASPWLIAGVRSWLGQA